MQICEKIVRSVLLKPDQRNPVVLQPDSFVYIFVWIFCRAKCFFGVFCRSVGRSVACCDLKESNLRRCIHLSIFPLPRAAARLLASPSFTLFTPSPRATGRRHAGACYGDVYSVVTATAHVISRRAVVRRVTVGDCAVCARIELYSRRRALRSVTLLASTVLDSSIPVKRERTARSAWQAPFDELWLSGSSVSNTSNSRAQMWIYRDTWSE